MELKLNNLTKCFGSKTAVNGLTVTFKPGVYGLLGANGAGKTTLMRMICDVLSPTEGEIYVDTNTSKAMGENYRRLLGYLPQNFGYYPDYTALEFMYYIAALKGISKSNAKRQIKQLLELVSLSGVANKKIKTFSGGMKQRLGIAQAVLGNPKTLILDEPTAGLDPKERVKFRNLIADFAKEKIVILSTHIVSDIEYIADYILIMKDGRLISSKPANEITKDIDGKVWNCTIPESKIDEVNAYYSVVNLHHAEGGNAIVRIVSDRKPFSIAVPTEPTLEDLYIYHFQNNENTDRR